jgi:acetoacetyl-CoA synthetase
LRCHQAQGRQPAFLAPIQSGKLFGLQIFHDTMTLLTTEAPAPIWQPSAARLQSARITAYLTWLEEHRGLVFDDYAALWDWSVSDLDGFWRSVWDYFDIDSRGSFAEVLTRRGMPGAQWFAGAQVNYARQVFGHTTALRPALVFADEAGAEETVSWHELERRVASLAVALRRFGVVPGDRVAAYLGNRPETVVAFLACASVGAIWSLCSPDMGTLSVLDRFRQIEPKILIAGDGYRYGGKAYSRIDILAEIRRGLPTVEECVLVSTLSETARTELGAPLGGVVDWRDLVDADAELQTTWVDFDHPLWIVYSSGTTGIPKAIVHGHGGIILGQYVSLGFHNDLGPEDRFHWYSSTGWIMWNCQVSGLLIGCTICLFDGNPGYPDLNTLWRFAGKAECTFFGAGAAFYASCLKAGVVPNEVADLGRLRSIGSTGSPLSPECYHWIYWHVGGGDIWLSPMSGGTDLAGPFVAGVPILPVHEGEMQCRVLGAAVHAFNAEGHAVVGDVGELVCTMPMPNMPLYFWGDKGNQRYIDSYFDTYPGVWRQGDWIRITQRGGAIIYGRSDATINRHGIRMGTSELYRAVEALPEIIDSLVVDLEYLGRPSYLPLFVVLRAGADLNMALKDKINARIRTNLSARHIPDEIFAVSAVPRTLSGKKLELPIKKFLLGHPAESVFNIDTMANPESLAWFVAFNKKRLEAYVSVLE